MFQSGFKRATDLAGAGIGLVVLAPLLVIVAALIKLTSGAPILFIQERTGLKGRPFRVLKFRTMTTDTVVEVGRETHRGDPRITPIGRALRNAGIDELPQLLNVLKGDMSLVGPRPLLQWENDQCDAHQRRRLLVRPGITGLSQIKGRNSIPWDERVEWDIKYVDHKSIRLDLLILLKTLPVALVGDTAYLEPATAEPSGLSVDPATALSDSLV